MRLLGATQPRSQRLAVILDPLVTRSLLGILGAALSGESVLKGRSMFVGREGEEIAAPGVTLVDDPTVADAFGAAAARRRGRPDPTDARSSTAASCAGSCTTSTRGGAPGPVRRGPRCGA